MNLREIIATVGLTSILTEALDRPREVTWKKNNDLYQSWVGEFQSPSGRWFQILISAARASSVWSFEFSEMSPTSLYIKGLISREELGNTALDATNIVGTRRPTGRGEAFAVYSTVFSALREFVREQRPEQVKFKGAVPRQTNFYKAMMKHYSADIKSAGYKTKGASLIILPS